MEKESQVSERRRKWKKLWRKNGCEGNSSGAGGWARGFFNTH